MLSTIFMTLFIVSVICAIIGFFIKSQTFALLGLAGLGFILLGVFSLSDGIEFRIGSNITALGDTEHFIFQDYPTTNLAVGLLSVALGCVCMIVAWTTFTEKKEKDYYKSPAIDDD